MLRLVAKDNQVFEILGQRGFDYAEITSIMDETDRIEQWGTSSAHLIATASRLLISTWASVNHRAGVFSCGKGCMAGVPKADIMFVVVASRLNKRIRAKLLAVDDQTYVIVDAASF